MSCFDGGFGRLRGVKLRSQPPWGHHAEEVVVGCEDLRLKRPHKGFLGAAGVSI